MGSQQVPHAHRRYLPGRFGCPARLDRACEPVLYLIVTLRMKPEVSLPCTELKRVGRSEITGLQHLPEKFKTEVLFGGNGTFKQRLYECSSLCRRRMRAR